MKGYCIVQKQKTGLQKMKWQWKNGIKTENRYENEGENEYSGAETGLKPKQTKSHVHSENEKQAYFLP